MEARATGQLGVNEGAMEPFVKQMPTRGSGYGTHARSRMSTRLVCSLAGALLLAVVAIARGQDIINQNLVTLDVTWTETYGDPDHVKVNAKMHARYKVDMFENPITHNVGAKACSGYEVQFPNLKDGNPFCFRLHYVEGAFDGGAATFDGRSAPIGSDEGTPVSDASFADAYVESIAPGLVTGQRPPRGYPVGSTASAQLSSGGGGVEIVFRTRPRYSINDDEASGCGSARDIQPTINYEQMRHLGRLDATWTAPAFDSGFGCSGTVTITVHGTCPLKSSLDMFTAMMTVFSHPRCVNCHGIVNPTTGANHGGGKVEQPHTPGDSLGNQVCLTCHTEAVTTTMDPVTHDVIEQGPWRLAPAELSFAGRNALALCQQIRSRMMRGTDMSSFVEHSASDSRILMGFEGLAGGAAKTPNPPPMTQKAFIEAAIDWVQKGEANCGC